MSRFIPLSEPHLVGNELAYVTECITTGWVSSVGTFVERFESEIAAYTGAAHAVATSSGTAALHTALLTLGIGPGDEVLVPTLTFIATANAVSYTGASPVFMDCDEYMNLDPESVHRFCEEECEYDDERLTDRATGKRVRAIVPVHIFGHPVNMEPIMQTARRYGLYVVEDACEALGSRYTSETYAGQAPGTIGDIGCLSFNGNKIITTGGGGMIVTQDAELARHAKHLTTQAKEDGPYYVHNEVGYNYRLTNIAAALGVAQIEQLDAFVQRKREIFSRYADLLAGVSEVRMVAEPPGTRSNCWLCSLSMQNGAGVRRDALMQSLAQAGVQARPVWTLNHTQRPYTGCEAYRIERATTWHESTLSLPSSVGITDDDVAYVAEKVRGFFGLA
jgi:perosamine synthetase